MDNRSDSVYISFQDAMKKADELIACANALDRLNNQRFRITAANLNHTWTGDSADAYRQKVELMSAKIERHAKELRKAAEGLKSSAERLYKVEQMGISLFGGKA